MARWRMLIRRSLRRRWGTEMTWFFSRIKRRSMGCSILRRLGRLYQGQAASFLCTHLALKMHILLQYDTVCLARICRHCHREDVICARLKRHSRYARFPQLPTSHSIFRAMSPYTPRPSPHPSHPVYSPLAYLQTADPPRASSLVDAPSRRGSTTPCASILRLLTAVGVPRVGAAVRRRAGTILGALCRVLTGSGTAACRRSWRGGVVDTRISW
jgi:hypothetical protein